MRPCLNDPGCTIRVHDRFSIPDHAILPKNHIGLCYDLSPATAQVPEFRVSYTVTTDALDALYKKLKPKGVTMTALLAKAAGVALASHPLLNAGAAWLSSRTSQRSGRDSHSRRLCFASGAPRGQRSDA